MSKQNKIITNETPKAIEPKKENLWPRVRIAILAFLTGIAIVSMVLLPSYYITTNSLKEYQNGMGECKVAFGQCVAYLNITMEKGRAITEEAEIWKGRCTAAQELGW